MIGKLGLEGGNDQPNQNSESKITPAENEPGSDLSYFDTCPEWELNTDELRKVDTAKRIERWL